MTVRSGVFTKYVVDFSGQSKFKVSNDPAAGDVIRDADITVTMGRGTLGTTFSIVIYDLPLDKLKLLKAATKEASDKAADKKPADDGGDDKPKKLAPIAPRVVKVQLGYFDTRVDLVMEGVVEKVSTKAGTDKTLGQDKLLTTITGQESATYACLNTDFSDSIPSAAAASYSDAANRVLQKISDNDKTNGGIADLVKIKDVQFDAKGARDSKDSDITFRKGKVMTALGELARLTKQELLIVDKNILFGSPIPKRGDLAAFSFSANLAKVEDLEIKPPEGGGGTLSCFSFTVLGDPNLRPGQPITLAELSDTFPGMKVALDKFVRAPSVSDGAYVIRDVEHQFNSTTGYICVGNATEVLKNGEVATAIDKSIKQKAAAAAQDVATAIKSEASKNPVIEVAAIKAAGKNPYKVDLFHGQPDNASQQPSIEVAVPTKNSKQVFENTPIASPFAWRKCGLVTPVYPGMTALVAHNVGLPTDGIVTGYMWSEKLDNAPPPDRHDDDWWLCLPVGLDGKSAPTDTTKAMNDLSSSAGKRVIEVKGLKITIGANKLANVGARPTEGGDDEFLIEHASGTTVQIDSSGKLTIDASKASVSIKGDVVIEGTLEIK